MAMRVGICADTHDRLPYIRRAIDRLNAGGVEIVLHAGDWISPFTIPLFDGLSAPVVGVFGNNDGDRPLLRRFAREREGLEIREDFAVVDLDGVACALLHGHQQAFLEEVIGSGQYPVVVRGHTHHPAIEEHDGVLVINPGEVCGYLTGRSTIAVLETGTMDTEIREL
ncbi:MAG: metallophosphoesterase [Methanomicrobiales archaeon]